MYEVMRYWDEDLPGWGEIERDFAAAWRTTPKFVASRSLKSVGPNASLVGEDVAAFARRLKAGMDGEIDVAGPALAGHLTELGLIDEYRLYFRLSCSAAASRFSLARGRRCGWSAARRWARTRCG